MNYQYLIGLLAFILFINSGITMERTTRESSPDENKHISSVTPTEALFTSLNAENEFSELTQPNLLKQLDNLISAGLRPIPIGYSFLFNKGSFKYMLKFTQSTDPIMFHAIGPKIVLTQKKQNFTLGKYTRSYEIQFMTSKLKVFGAFDIALVGKAFHIPINKE